MGRLMIRIGDFNERQSISEIPGTRVYAFDSQCVYLEDIREGYACSLALHELGQELRDPGLICDLYIGFFLDGAEKLLVGHKNLWGWLEPTPVARSLTKGKQF